MENIENIIIIAVLAAIVAGIAFYLYRSKKRGKSCTGCPCSKNCSGNCSGKK